MQGLNRTQLIGNLGQDPELRYTQSGNAVLALRLAVNTRFKASDGEWRERTEWFSVAVWGGRAEGLNKLLSKGAGVYVEGEMRSRKYEARDGSERIVWELHASELLLLNREGKPASSQRDNEASQSQRSFHDDDIPF